MLKHLNDTLTKRCLIGLTYFDATGKELKQQLLGGVVKSVDAEMGITLTLLGNKLGNKSSEKNAEFIIPANLACWFNAPKGDFHTSNSDIKISNPDYLITWDIYQTTKKPEQGKPEEGEQQWWEWVPRTQDPQVN